MRTLGNIIWHIPYLGFLWALIYAIVGLFWCITIIGIPLGLGLLQISLFMLAPFNKRLVARKDLEMITGETQGNVIKGWFLIVRILYFPFGLLAAISAILSICIEFVTIVGIPCALVYSKALGAIFNPVNKRCVPISVAEEIERLKSQNTLQRYNKQSSTQTINKPQEDIKKPEALSETKTELSCPQCHKTIQSDWNVCPFCGCDFKAENEKKRQEDENLRYAPPQYRKS